MKPLILLINPPHKFRGKDLTYKNIVAPEYPPLNLAYLAANLEKYNYEVAIIDCNNKYNIEDDILSLIESGKPILIGLTCTSPLFNNAKSIAEFIKKKGSSTPIVLGGIHATLVPKLMEEETMFDFLVSGEGEQTIVELVRTIENKDDFSRVDGLVFRKEGMVIFNQPRQQIENLDDLPFPDRNLFENQAYRYPDALYAKTASMITSRGCPGRCIYCASQNIFPKVKIRSAENVVEEIEILAKEFGIKEIHFWDDNFIISKSRVLKIRDLLKEKNIKVKFAFPNGIRADMVDYELLLALKEMGVYNVSFGVESGSQKILDSTKKKITLEKIRNAFVLAKKLKFETWGFFMIGFPGETEDDVNKTIEFAKEINPDIVKFNILIPYPGTEVNRQLSKQGLIIEKDISKYAFHSYPVHYLPTLSINDMIRLHSKAYREFYLRPGKLLQQLLRLKSWQRIKTNFKTGLVVFQLMFKQGR